MEGQALVIVSVCALIYVASTMAWQMVLIMFICPLICFTSTMVIGGLYKRSVGNNPKWSGPQ
jgi:hypothetical protein